MRKTCRIFASLRQPVFASSYLLYLCYRTFAWFSSWSGCPILIRDYAKARSLPRSCLYSLETSQPYAPRLNAVPSFVRQSGKCIISFIRCTSICHCTVRKAGWRSQVKSRKEDWSRVRIIHECHVKYIFNKRFMNKYGIICKLDICVCNNL